MMFSQLLVIAGFTIALLVIFSSPHLSGLLTQIAHADFNFGAVGDWGCNSNTAKTVSNFQAKRPERVLALGDYSYQPTATCWLNYLTPIKGVTRINIGNHENEANEGLSQYLSAFGLSPPKTQYYSFDYVNAHVLTMATELSYAKGSSQYNFVVNDLKTAAANPNIKWIIVNFHKIIYTSPNTCSSCGGSSSLRNTYHPLFDQYGVDLVLQAHVHNYQRTYPLIYDTDGTPTRTSTNPSSYTDPQGEVFATVGTGGVGFHGFSGSRSYFVVYQQAIRFGLLDITIANDGTKLQGKYYLDSGSLADQFTISKPTTISSLKISTANKVNITNQTSPQKIIDQLSSNQTAKNNQTAENREIGASNDRKSIILPDLSQIINNTRSSENTATKVDNNQKSNSQDANNENSNLAVKPDIPKEPDKNLNTNVRNSLPVANAGRNQIAPEGSEVILDGSRSNDRDGKIESYQWQQASGPKINLDDENKIKPEFVAPSVEHDAILVFRLIVTDEKGGSDSAITAVKITNEQSPPSISNIPDSSDSNSEADLPQLTNVTNSSAR